MEATKRTYQKHKTEKKITVKHYLNETINEFSKTGDKVIPVYVQVTYQGKNTRFRSRIKPIPSYLLRLNTDGRFDISTFVEERERDAALITFLVKEFSNLNARYGDDRYDINDLASMYHNEINDLSCFIDNCLNSEIQDIVLGNNDNYCIHGVKPLISIEYFKTFYPNLKSIQERYNSNIWLFDSYLNQITNCELVEFGKEHDIKRASGIVIGGLWNPTVQDFKDNYAQKQLLKYFRKSQSIKDVIRDIQKLFDKYIEDYTFQYF